MTERSGPEAASTIAGANQDHDDPTATVRQGGPPPYDPLLEWDCLAGLTTSDFRAELQRLSRDDFYVPAHRDALDALKWLDTHGGIRRSVVIRGTNCVLTVERIDEALAAIGARDAIWVRHALERALHAGHLGACGDDRGVGFGDPFACLRSKASARRELVILEARIAELLDRHRT